MKIANRASRRSIAAMLGALTTAGLGLAVSSAGNAQSSDYNTDLTIAEIMDAIVMREADVIWQSVSYKATKDGDVRIAPETDDDWTELRRAALSLAEVTNNLMIPGRHADKPDAEVGEGELSPAEMDAKIKEQRAAWVAFAKSLRATAMQTVAAIDDRDLDKILDVGGSLDDVCESCHLVFWYPNQRIPGR